MPDGEPSNVMQVASKMAWGTWERSPTIAIFAIIVGACMWVVYSNSREDREEMRRVNMQLVETLKTTVNDTAKIVGLNTRALNRIADVMERSGLDRNFSIKGKDNGDDRN